MTNWRSLTLSGLVGLAPATARAATFGSDVVDVPDGESLTLAVGSTIKLYGIDAPELGQRCWRASGEPYDCGAQAREELRRLTQGQRVECTPVATIEGVRHAECSIGTINVGRTMVASGFAVTSAATTPETKRAELIARQKASGIWSGCFQAPSEYRLAGAKRSEAPETCHPEETGRAMEVPRSHEPVIPKPACAEFLRLDAQEIEQTMAALLRRRPEAEHAVLLHSSKVEAVLCIW